MQRRILYVGLFLVSLGLGLGLATYFRSVNRAVEPKPVTALQAAEPTATTADTVERFGPEQKIRTARVGRGFSTSRGVYPEARYKK